MQGGSAASLTLGAGRIDFGLIALRGRAVARTIVAIGTASLVVAYAAPLATALITAGPPRAHSLDPLALPSLRFPGLQVGVPSRAHSTGATHRAAAPLTFRTPATPRATAPVARSQAPSGAAIAVRRNWIDPPPLTTNRYGSAPGGQASAPASPAAGTDAGTVVTTSVGSEPAGFDAAATATATAT
ncbi:MAG: hypothetical protein ACRDLK_14215, partial [Gaiellaceae bacterium]